MEKAFFEMKMIDAVTGCLLVEDELCQAEQSRGRPYREDGGGVADKAIDQVRPTCTSTT
jgi:hypothetical protein